MKMYPVYQDALTVANLKENQLPFYITKNTINSSYPLHHHDFMELSFVYEGYGYEKINGEDHPMQPGTASILLPHHIHEIHSETDTPIRLYCCMFDMNILFDSPYDAILGNYLLKTGTDIPSHYDLDVDQFFDVKRIMDKLYEAHQGSAFMKNSFIRVKLIEAFIIILRSNSIFNKNLLTQQNIPDQNATKKIMEIVRYVHLYYREPLSLKMLSNIFYLSAPYISRLFKEQTGQNFTDYLHALRIKSALSLLVTTNMSINEIAMEIGFEHIRSFSRVFREKVGVTAREYRNRKRQAWGHFDSDMSDVTEK